MKENLTDKNLQNILLLSHQFSLPLVKRQCFRRLEDLSIERNRFWIKIRKDEKFQDLILEFLDFLSENQSLVT